MAPVKILSWNIWGGKFLSQVTSFLKKADAGIVTLQEAEEAGGTNTAEVIAKALDYSCVYVRSMEYEHDGKRSYRGNAVLSKYPIIRGVSFSLSSEQTRTAMQADIDIRGGIVHVVSVHLIHSHQTESPRQEEQVNTLIRMVPREHALIMGDFNALPESRTIHLMRNAFRDSDASDKPTWCLYPDGCGVCKPDKVKWKLDYMFTTSDIVLTGFDTGKSRGSDHLPVFALLK